MCTFETRGSIFILTLTGEGEHRLNPTLLESIQSSLHRVRQEATVSSALITTAHSKFFSNGYDLAWAQSSRERMIPMDSLLRSVVSDLLTLPVPTIAAVTGHASAAGYTLALAHDYFLMHSDRGFPYMSELDISLVIPAWFIALLEAKVATPAARRHIVMSAAKTCIGCKTITGPVIWGGLPSNGMIKWELLLNHFFPLQGIIRLLQAL